MDRLLLAVALGGRVVRLPFVVALAAGLASASATTLVSAPSPSVSSFLRLSLPASGLNSTLKCLKKVWPSRGSTSPFSAGITAHSTFGIVNLPTRTVGMTSRLASTTVPSAVFNWTVGITGLGLQADATGELGRDGGEAGSRVENHFRGDFAETGVDVEDAILAVQLDGFALDRTLGLFEQLDGIPDLRRRAQPLLALGRRGKRLERLGDLRVLGQFVVLRGQLVHRFSQVEDRLHVLLPALGDLGDQLGFLFLSLVLVLFLERVEHVDHLVVFRHQEVVSAGRAGVRC